MPPPHPHPRRYQGSDTRARFGLSFLGPAWSEASLIGYAYAYEQRTRTRDRVQPYIVPSTELVDVVGKANATGATVGRRGLRNRESVRRYEMVRSGEGKRELPRREPLRGER